MRKTIGYAAKHSVSDLRPMFIERRDPGPGDVAIDVLYCGVCHSDIHQARNEWHNTLYPCMPGHEIAGRVSAVGSQVTRFKVGDLVGVGCMVDSCGKCPSCLEGLEQYCSSEKGCLATYNGNQRKPAEDNHTYGGYSEHIVVRESFVLRLPAGIEPHAAAPILCAGVTTYSPMRHWKVGPGTKLGVVGLGGLGHMAVKLARAMGAEVTVITHNKDKRDDALKLGASHVVLSTDEQDMKGNASTLDFILSTIPKSHDANPYIALLRRDGIYTVVGCLVPLKLPLDMSKMILDRRSVGSSVIGSIRETQEVLDFCAKHGITPNVKVIPVDDVNEAFKKVDAGEVDYRFVIDMATIRGKQEDESIAAKVGL